MCVYLCFAVLFLANDACAVKHVFTGSTTFTEIALKSEQVSELSDEQASE